MYAGDPDLSATTWGSPYINSTCFQIHTFSINPSQLHNHLSEPKFFNPLHIVPFAKFHRIGGASQETFQSVKYDAPEEVVGDRKCFDSPIRK